MTSKEISQLAEHLHRAWEAGAGVRVPLTLRVTYQWEAWHLTVANAIAASDWIHTTPAELLGIVLKYRRRQAAGKPDLLRRWIALSAILNSPDRCLEDWAYAEAEQRQKVARVSSPLGQVLRATGRRDETEKRRDGATATARTAGNVLAGEQAFAEFLKLKGNQ